MAGYDPEATEHAQMRKPTSKPKTEPPKPKTSVTASTNSAVDASAPSAQYTEEERQRREDLVEQLMKINDSFLKRLERGKEHAASALEKHDIQPSSEIWKLLSLAVGTAVAAASGGIAAAIVAPMLETAEQVAVAGLFKNVVSKVFAPNLAPTQWNPEDLIESYVNEVERQLDAADTRFATEWSATRATLRRLPTFALEAFANHAAEGLKEGTATLLAKRHFLVGWTNFLARAMHGAMHWDPWQSGGSAGAIKLEGARDPWNEPSSTRSDPTTANVDPNAMGWALERTQRPMMPEHYGILEIFLDRSGNLVHVPGYGMRLDNVGPKVRMEMRQMGKVRDLKVNKVVRMCSYIHDGIEVDPPAPLASILITADGYVRAHDWARFMKAHVEESGPRKPWDIKGDFGRCMDQLIEGRETNSCNIDHASENAEISAFAERAQNLALSELKV
jgi:hypothetical protein